MRTYSSGGFDDFIGTISTPIGGIGFAAALIGMLLAFASFPNSVAVLFVLCAGGGGFFYVLGFLKYRDEQRHIEARRRYKSERRSQETLDVAKRLDQNIAEQQKAIRKMSSDLMKSRNPIQYNIISHSKLVNANLINENYERIYQVGNLECADDLAKIAAAIAQSENIVASTLFERFQEELSSESPKSETLGSLWKGIVQAVPTIKSMTDIVNGVIRIAS